MASKKPKPRKSKDKLSIDLQSAGPKPQLKTSYRGEILRERRPARIAAAETLPTEIESWEDSRQAGLKPEAKKAAPFLSLSDAVLPSASATPEAFLATASVFFRSEHDQLNLSRESLARRLQKYLKSVCGQTFDPETKEVWCGLLNSYLLATGLAVECLGKDCEGKAALPKFRISSEHPEGAFRTEHLESAKQTRHGNRTLIPDFKVLPRPFIES